MFRKKHYFSEKERQELFMVQHQYVQAIVDRSNNPGDFDVNITCLKTIKTACATWLSIIQPYLEKSLESTSKSFNSPFKLFGLAILGRELYSQSKIMQEAQKVLFPKSVTALIKTEFAKEPRIILLNAHEDHKETTTIKDSNTKTTMTDITEYTITFSDNSKLIIHSLDDKELAAAKVQFDNKMRELSLLMEFKM